MSLNLSFRLVRRGSVGLGPTLQRSNCDSRHRVHCQEICSVREVSWEPQRGVLSNDDWQMDRRSILRKPSWHWNVRLEWMMLTFVVSEHRLHPSTSVAVEVRSKERNERGLMSTRRSNHQIIWVSG